MKKIAPHTANRFQRKWVERQQFWGVPQRAEQEFIIAMWTCVVVISTILGVLWMLAMLDVDVHWQVWYLNFFVPAAIAAYQFTTAFQGKKIGVDTDTAYGRTVKTYSRLTSQNKSAVRPVMDKMLEMHTVDRGLFHSDLLKRENAVYEVLTKQINERRDNLLAHKDDSDLLGIDYYINPQKALDSAG